VPTDRQRQLEELLAHQQHLIDELNGVVTQQRLEMDTMQRRLKSLESKLQAVAERAAAGGEDLPHEKPPHY